MLEASSSTKNDNKCDLNLDGDCLSDRFDCVGLSKLQKGFFYFYFYFFIFSSFSKLMVSLSW